ncbi:MAG: transposase [Nitrospinae bacterium]|nr:transposase [Nitrospinota bacterium]
MDKKLFEILENFRPCFSRKATYCWFILVMIGLTVRADHYGISSIVRWVSLSSNCYFSLLHFFGSTGWTLDALLLCWWNYCLQDPLCLKIQGRAILIGDHTNQPKEGQRMPGVLTIHQHSETSSKPSYFRGHVWGFIALVIGKGQKCFAVPLQGELNIEERNSESSCSLATRIVHNAIQIAEKMDCPVYLVLDAFFAISPVFWAVSVYGIVHRVVWVHIITRAKKSIVAYLDPPSDTPGKRGRKRKYGEKLKLIDLFKKKANEFIETTCFVYGRTEVVQLLCLDLLWKPIKGKIRFVLAITSRGHIILMSSDLTLPAVQILELYCQRASIESMFLVLKHLIGGLCYRFWARLIEKSSRRPKKNKSSKVTGHKETIENKVRAIEMFVNLSAILVGILQILALRFPQEIWRDNTLWLRTFSNAIPSEYIAKNLLVQTILMNLHKVNPHAIYTLIRSRQFQPNDAGEFKYSSG